MHLNLTLTDLNLTEHSISYCCAFFETPCIKRFVVPNEEEKVQLYVTQHGCVMGKEYFVQVQCTVQYYIPHSRVQYTV